MNPTAWFVYLVIVLTWGTSWFVVKYQIGEVEPLVSVVYRFALGAVLLFAWCRARGHRLRIGSSEHVWLAGQGACLFGVNYWLVYLATEKLTSGLIAVIFASLAVFNLFNGRLFLKRSLSPIMLTGALVGFAGVCLLLWPDVAAMEWSLAVLGPVGFAFGGAYLASLGNIFATHTIRFGLSVFAANAWGMLYGSASLALFALGLGMEFRFPATTEYVLALVHLSVFASVIAFSGMIYLIGLIGPEKTGYISTVVPVVALLVSTQLEAYEWTVAAVVGLLMIAFGNFLMMRPQVQRVAGS